MKDSDKNRAILAEVVARSWREPKFRDALRKDPKKTLQGAGMDIAANLKVVLLENSATVFHAVLPPRSEMKTYSARFDRAVKRLHDLPDDVEVRIRRDTPTTTFVVLPAAPAAAVSGELSDADLEQVAGGKSATAVHQAAVGVTSAVQTAEAVTTAVEAQDVATTSTVAAEVEVAVVPCFIS